MNIETYNNFIISFRAKGDKQANEKRVEYTESRGDEDVLANFKATAFDLNLDPLQILATFMKKHWSSIINFIKTGKVFSDEDVLGRIQDLIQYLELTAACITEKRALDNKIDHIEGEEVQINEDDFELEVEFTDPPQVINKDTIRKTVEEKKGIQNDQEC